MTELKADFGVLYFVDENPKFLEMLELSLQSLKRYHPDWPVEVIRCPCFPVPLWKKLYRAASFWKWHLRRDLGNRDARVVGAKASAMLESPFRHTLLLDVDTVVMQPLDVYRQKLEEYDVVVTANPWKHYEAVAADHPARFQYLNSGVVFYTQRFTDVYRDYVERLGPCAAALPTMDQYIFSMACEIERDKLRIAYEPELQMDVINVAEHFGCEDYPRRGEILDLDCEKLRRFHVFHYNELKPHYMRQIAEVWGLTAG